MEADINFFEVKGIMKLGLKKFDFLLVFLFANFLVLSQVNAMVVAKVKGSKVLVNLQGAEAKIGQVLQVLGSDNRPTATLKVVNVSKGKALAHLINGKAAEKSKVVSVAAQTASQSAPPAVREPKPKQPEGPRPPYLASVLLGLASNTLSLRVGDGITSQNVDNTGNSVGVAVAVDHQYFQPWFRARALLAYEQFNAIGAATINGCANQTSKDCTTDIKYLSAGGYAKYDKEYSQFHFWGAGGLNFKVPISKKSTALVESSLGVTASYGLTLGADFTLETKKFITASLEKQFYIKSDSAETSTVFIRLGVGQEF